MSWAKRFKADPLWWHLLLILCVSSAYEVYFVGFGLNWLDEGWPLYAAHRLQQGGTLYLDVFWVFPPGHLLPAWIGQLIEPPGVFVARYIYAAFHVALNVSMYLLGRRLMPPSHALLGTLLLALAAPQSHVRQYLFAYRYLAFSAVALLFYARRLSSGNARWMLPAGLLTGVALCFRLTPAFAVGAALAVAIVASSRSWQDWLRDGGWFALGFAVVVLPVIGYLAGSVGLDVVWREVVVRAVVMTDLQQLPIPDLFVPKEWTRLEIVGLFIAIQFRVYALMYIGYAAALTGLWLRSLLQGAASFRHTLLLAVVVWGGTYFLRALGRADQGHLDSALPPVCLLLAHAISLALRALPRLPQWPVLAAALAFWIFSQDTDRHLSPEFLGTYPALSLDGRASVTQSSRTAEFDGKVAQVRVLVQPGEPWLDLSGAPLFYVLAGRDGPGVADVVLPGTFMNEAEELAFLEILKEDPPVLIMAATFGFDLDKSGFLHEFAPNIQRWAKKHYRLRGTPGYYSVMVPRNPGPP